MTSDGWGTGNWVTLIVMLVGFAVTWGGVVARLKINEKKTDGTAEALEKSRERQGGRIGRLEERMAALEGHIDGQTGAHRVRIPTRGGGVPVATDADGSGGA